MTPKICQTLRKWITRYKSIFPSAHLFSSKHISVTTHKPFRISCGFLIYFCLCFFFLCLNKLGFASKMAHLTCVSLFLEPFVSFPKAILFSILFQLAIFCLIISTVAAYDTAEVTSRDLDHNKTQNPKSEVLPAAPYNKPDPDIRSFLHSLATTESANPSSSQLPSTGAGRSSSIDNLPKRSKRSTIPFRPLFVYREFEEGLRSRTEKRKLMQEPFRNVPLRVNSLDYWK